MSRPVLLSLLLLAASFADAQGFEDFAGLEEQIVAIRSRSRRLAASVRRRSRTRRRRRDHRMGGRRVRRRRRVPAGPQPDISSYTVRGIDISHHQGEIDWDQVKGQGLSFVYMKATEGDDFQDERFAANWEGAARAGLLRGAYHFYDLCQEGAPQAENLFSVLPAEAGMLPPAIDIERDGGCRPSEMPTREAFLEQFSVFIEAVTERYGVKPVLYLEKGIYFRYLQGVAEGYDLWFPDPDSVKPEVPEGLQWKFWQHSCRGRVPGIEGPVDLDVFYGDPKLLPRT